MNNKHNLLINENEYYFKNIEDKLSKNPTYLKMLNNLLGVGSRDNAVCASSKYDNFNLQNLLSSADLKKVLTQKSFKVNIENKKDLSVLSLLESASDFSEFVEIADSNGLFLSLADRILLEKNFNANQDSIVSKLKKKEAQFIAKWKKFENKYKDKQSQTNLWPLYIGTMFIEVKTNTTALYAPLLLKKVKLNISNLNKVEIEDADDSVEINEKLLFLLKNDYKINFPKLDTELPSSFNELIPDFKDTLSAIIKNDFNSQGDWSPKTKSEIKSVVPKFMDGTAMMIAFPGGGALRDQLLKMINNDQIGDLLEIDNSKDLTNEINNYVVSGEGIYRITKTDLSQERAIIGGMQDNSIIWGPPGTGKSQTVANIIANLLVKKKKVLITSEKKAALDVLLERVGSLKKYVFFGLTDKNISKHDFYQPFQELASTIAKSDINITISPSKSVNQNTINYYDNKKELEFEDIDNLVAVHNFFEENQRYLPYVKENFKNICEYDNVLDDFIEQKNLDNALLKNGITKRGWIFKRYDRDVKSFISTCELFKDKLNILSQITKVNNFYNVENIEQALNQERHYKADVGYFKNDVDKLEQYLAAKFKGRITTIKNKSEDSRKLVNSFLAACNSGFALPHKFIAKYKKVIDLLFDIYVSTPNILAGIIDFDKDYDYVIFDEASQMHLEKAIPFLGVAKIAIIAGDHQQMRPTSYFEIRDNEEMTGDFEEEADSLLDFAYNKGLRAREYMLTKNYRSVSAELMTFSSKHFYNSKLDVVDSVNYEDHTSIEVYDVEGKWEARTNAIEAEHMLDCALNNLSAYSKKKIILLTLNSTQKEYVESLIYKEEKYFDVREAIGTENVVLRNLENIQGDEADLVIVSVAYDKSAKLGSTYVARPEGKNALNVAISRAKEKMIVFKSIYSDDVQVNKANTSIIIFKDWLFFLENDQKTRKEYLLRTNSRASEFDSSFEEDVYDLLSGISLNTEAHVETQFNVGSYFIDMAIIDSNTGKFILGIEVDGYKYHSGYEKMMADIERQSFIESKGYAIHRITELDWKINKQKSLKDIQTICNKKISKP